MAAAQSAASSMRMKIQKNQEFEQEVEFRDLSHIQDYFNNFTFHIHVIYMLSIIYMTDIRNHIACFYINVNYCIF